jgi:hypothetical protein
VYKILRIPHPNNVHNSKETALNELETVSAIGLKSWRVKIKSILQMDLHRYSNPRNTEHATDIVTQKSYD